MPAEIPYSGQADLKKFVEQTRDANKMYMFHSRVWVYAKMVTDQAASELSYLAGKSIRGETDTLGLTPPELKFKVKSVLKNVILGNFIMAVEDMLVERKYYHGVFTSILNNSLSGTSFKEQIAPVEGGEFKIDEVSMRRMFAAAKEDLTLAIFAKNSELIPLTLRDYLSNRRLGKSDALQMIKEGAEGFRKAAECLVDKA